jgi:hypothetical protein
LSGDDFQHSHCIYVITIHFPNTERGFAQTQQVKDQATNKIYIKYHVIVFFQKQHSMEVVIIILPF